jgi:hypothetical protein
MLACINRRARLQCVARWLQRCIGVLSSVVVDLRNLEALLPEIDARLVVRLILIVFGELLVRLEHLRCRVLTAPPYCTLQHCRRCPALPPPTVRAKHMDLAYKHASCNAPHCKHATRLLSGCCGHSSGPELTVHCAPSRRPSVLHGGLSAVASTAVPRQGSPLPHLHRDWAHPYHICTRIGLTPTTSAPGLGSPLPHLHRDWAHPCHICTGTGLPPTTSARRPVGCCVAMRRERLRCHDGVPALQCWLTLRGLAGRPHRREPVPAHHYGSWRPFYSLGLAFGASPVAVQMWEA